MRHSPFGDSLRQAREEAGRTLPDIAASTKIRAEYLRALEEGDFAVLPERPFARSYLKRYAAELGVDAAPLLAEFDRAVPQRPEISSALRGTQATRRPVVPVGALAAVFSSLVVVGALGWAGYAMWRSSTGVTPPESGATVPLTTERQIRLSVASRPSGARVYLDNRLLGETPVREFPLEARNRGQLRLELSGHKTVRQNVDLGQTRTIQVQLEREDAAQVQVGEGATPGDQVTASSAVTPTPQKALSAPSAPTSTAPAPAVSPAPVAGAASVPASADGGVTLLFRGRSWVRVTSPSGRVLYEGIPQVGAERVFPAGVTVRVGAPTAVQIRQGSAEAAPFGSGASPVTRRFP
ncbi:helix-turn-helix domain-containing protein [Deinococcus peraridilitoris]|uniref:HTH cro/C1-type domain-containing protein n=1 Tax=Deinococcus peraridilitoris (strain DSM 19664 / LMG 22246 / CIP 109416 / KR-200) TaxID=937777 RepID=L0A5K5_DEIPD|nr:helix-turn-helix domain-containing protein [Deinococcus peraridilitoris]AFZ68467.1 hypothetical protein Deipe_3017 [Deinococcus peraridilitoris DSM 19664]